MTYQAERLQPTVAEHWTTVGDYLSTALREIATDLGDASYAESIMHIAAEGDSTLLNPDALRQLNQDHPGAASQVFDRAEAIQHIAHQQELASLRTGRARRVASSVIAGFGWHRTSGQ